MRLIIARGLRGTRATKEDVKELTQDVLLAEWEASEQECAAVLSHDIDEIPMEDVASELGAPVSTVYKWRARGIAALARALRPARR